MASLSVSLYTERTRQGAVLPGLLLCLAVSAAAIGAEQIEAWIAGRAWVEALVLAILIGTAIRTARAIPQRFQPGIAFSAKTLLEIAVALLGATISVQTILSAGLPLISGIAAMVGVAITASYGLGRLMGLPRRMAMLVACGNAICGNSAIAAVAPVIGADSEDVAASIAFTAALGVVVVLLLPGIAAGLHLNPSAGGALAGLTVYAVPQVLAAAAPMGGAGVQLGTIAKLVRVLMLGPVVLTLSILAGGRKAEAGARFRFADIGRFLPWFILAFLVIATLRSIGVLPDAAAAPAGETAKLLTIVSMAALGLGVDLRALAAAGPRVTAVVTCSLLLLGAMALALLWACGMIGGPSLR